MLRRCLESIVAAYSSYVYDELVLVDNNSGEAEAELNQQLAAKFGATYGWEGRGGVLFARNTGIRMAGGDILVFADDDFIVNKDWVKNLIPDYDDEHVMCCTGRMLPYRHDEASSVVYRTMGYDRGISRRIFTADDVNLLKLLKTVLLIGRMRLGEKAPVPWAIGSGFLSFRRCIFDQVGYFDERLADPRLTTLSAGEDVDMFYRLLKSNYKIVYEPRAVIRHDDPQTMAGIIKKSYTYGIGRQILFNKYRRDCYMQSLCIGSFFFLLFAWLRATMKLEWTERKVVTAEIKGFFDGISTSWRRNMHGGS
jgi:glycosyltransferase involved in cell wall biosynthesis